MARGPRARALEARPETHEEAEREREEHAIAWAEPGRAQHHRPAARPPRPGFLRVEPAQRRAGGARGLVHAHVAIDRMAQVGAERWVRGLVLHQLALRRERQPLEVAPGSQVARVDEPGPPAAGPEERV